MVHQQTDEEDMVVEGTMEGLVVQVEAVGEMEEVPLLVWAPSLSLLPPIPRCNALHLARASPFALATRRQPLCTSFCLP